MTQAELVALKRDFLEWTGGFEPETDEEIASYISTSMPLRLEMSDAQEALSIWMKNAHTAADPT